MRNKTVYDLRQIFFSATEVSPAAKLETFPSATIFPSLARPSARFDLIIGCENDSKPTDE